MKRYITIFCVAAFALFAFLLRVPIREAVGSLNKPALPPAQGSSDFTLPTSSPLPPVPPVSTVVVKPTPQAPTPPQKTSVGTSTADNRLPSSINLDVPFASQAPLGDWNMPYQEACEEAAIIMAHYYFTGKKMNANVMNDEILKLVNWQNKTFGYYKDTNVEEIARMMREFYGHKKITVKYDITAEDIKKALAKGQPVLIPAAGRVLPNPYFRQPGPLYHVVVVKGYTDGKFITNDPGTRMGKDFLYAEQVLMDAVHDWNAADIFKGRKAMIAVGA